MNSDRALLVIALIVNSALYLAGCFVMGLATRNPAASLCAVAAAGVNYLAFFSQLSQWPRLVSAALVALSIATGLAAGLSLLG